jgi:putative polyhydroxyalkanoate system protein
MAKVRVEVEHKLGRARALAHIRATAESMRAKADRFVKSVEWTDNGATVVGEGFKGRLEVDETKVIVEADLGFALSLFPVKAEREMRAWIQKVLDSAAGSAASS